MINPYTATAVEAFEAAAREGYQVVSYSPEPEQLHVWWFRLRGDRAAAVRDPDPDVRVRMMLLLIADRRQVQRLR